MKKALTLLGAILFSILFYQQNIGLNVFLFSVLTSLIVVIHHPKIIQQKNGIRYLLVYLISGATVFFYTNSLAIIANSICFISLIGSISNPKSSIYVKWLNGAFSSIAAYFYLYFNNDDVQNKNKEKKQIDYVYWLKIIGIPFVVVLVFISLYRNANPVFDELTTAINFRFINFQWLVFTALGYFLYFNISTPVQVEQVTKKDLATTDNLVENEFKEASLSSTNQEKQLALVLFVLLNLLILIFLGTDIFHLAEIYKMSAPELSGQVHNGVNALIVSTVLAIVIILYFFRGKLNFIQHNHTLKKLTALWILLNVLVVLSTVMKNTAYINSFGLTYKRIGVLFFLIATTIGLVTSYIKVFKIKNMWFLFRKNTRIAFAVLILSACVNWDKAITYYNINYAHDLDITYLINLSNNNAFLLHEYAQKNSLKEATEKKIVSKYETYIKTLNANSWQELVLDNVKQKK